MKKIFGRIAPVGNPISLKTSDEIPVFPGSLKTYFLNSGTAALAAGLQIAQQHCNAKNPEVIIPAYCCPDLLSAILYNNMKPVLVDFIPNKPYMDLDGLQKALSENTVAVIAVNFLGIPERFNEIKKLLADMPTLLIEDSAQWFPETDDAFSEHAGDLVVYSFGKGKPVSLLGGGALCVRDAMFEGPTPGCLSHKGSADSSMGNIFLDIVKYFAYNVFTSPYAYWFLEIAPFINLGETRFHSLTTVESKPYNNLAFLSSNIHAYQQRVPDATSLWVHMSKRIAPQNVTMLKDLCKTYKNQRLLRLPLLFEDTEVRNQFLAAANNDGVGVSQLYPEILSKISDVPFAPLTDPAFPNAEHFSKHLVTLPTHSHVSQLHTRRILNFLA